MMDIFTARRLSPACWFAAAICAAVLLGPTAPLAEAADDDDRTLLDLTYVERESGPVKLDLYLPDEDIDDPPLVMWIHGGGWQMGNRHPNPLAELTEEGYAVASISYRYSTVAPHPAQHHDCQAAIRWLRKHADEYGYDADRLGVVGGSAGAHLVGLLATAADHPELTEQDLDPADAAISTEIQAAVSFAGPMDLPLMIEQEPHEDTLRLIEAFVDGPPHDNIDIARQASGITHVHADAAPLLMIHGDQDNHVPHSQAQLMHEAMQEVGATSELVMLEGVGHDAGLGDPDVRQIMKNFLVRYLRH